MPSILNYFKYAQLATAAYVRMGTEPLTGQRFAEVAREQTRLPLSIAQYLFDPDNDYNAPVWTIAHYYGSDNLLDPIAYADRSGFGATLFTRGTEKVLAIRGTEPFEDGFVDLLSADIGQIGVLGVALSQTVSMINLIQRMRAGRGQSVSQLQLAVSDIRPTDVNVRHVEAQGLLGTTVYLEFRQTKALGLDLIDPGQKITVTGHSLSGELAVLATLLFPETVNAELTIFNAAGINPNTADITALASGLLGAPGLFLAAPIAAALGADLGLAGAQLSQTGQQLARPLLETMLETLYGLPQETNWGGRFDFSQPAGVFAGLSINNLRSEDLVPGNDFNAIPSALTGADIYPAGTDIATEANSHVMEPFMDALALHAVLYRLNDELSLAEHEKLLLAASPELNRSEEALAEALFKLFLPQDTYLSARDGKGIPTYGADSLPLSDATTGRDVWVGDVVAGGDGMLTRFTADTLLDEAANAACYGKLFQRRAA